MENQLISTLKGAVKNWWISLLIGIVAVALGIWFMCTPLTTFLALTIVFVVKFFMGGILEIGFAISNKNIIKNWGWNLAMGIIDLLFAIYLLANMNIAPGVLCYLIAFWIFFKSIWGIGIAFDLKQYRVSDWGWLLALSILGLFFAMLLLFEPAVTAVFAAYIIAFSFIFYGVFRIYLSFKLKSLHDNAKDLRDTINTINNSAQNNR